MLICAAQHTLGGDILSAFRGIPSPKLGFAQRYLKKA